MGTVSRPSRPMSHFFFDFRLIALPHFLALLDFFLFPPDWNFGDDFPFFLRMVFPLFFFLPPNCSFVRPTDFKLFFFFDFPLPNCLILLETRFVFFDFFFPKDLSVDCPIGTRNDGLSSSNPTLDIFL